MNRDYHEIRISVADEEKRSILMAMLEGIGFESFVEEEDALLAYIPVGGLDKARLEKVLSVGEESFEYSDEVREDKNWNEEWEKNYPPVIIADKCYIRAPFHEERKDIPIEILIEPRMAFGTAHHQTTALMLEWELETDFREKFVLDMGCGTGVLAILANKMGASSVMAVDNDEWAYLNTLDNIFLNDTGNCSVHYDDVAALEGEEFDIILANINRNILLQDIPAYSASLKPGGLMFLSGFYEDDTDAIAEVAKQNNLEYQGAKSKDSWTALSFRKL